VRTGRARLLSLALGPRHDPIIVLGNQKSGTTAIAALLARHLGGRATLDMPALLDELPEPASWRDFVRRYGWYFRHPVVKEPWLTFAYADLRALFPAGRFLLVVRDPRDNLRSILDRLGLPGDQTANPAALNQAPRGWRELFPRSITGEAVHYIEELGERWNQGARLAWEPDPPLETWVRYEDFVADKAGTIARLAQAVGEPGVEDIATAVDRDYQPAGQSRGMPWRAFFGADNLARLEHVCREGMTRFGYLS
jgi:hypothetical protein